MTHTTEHIDEQTFSQFVLNDDAIDEQKRFEIERHIAMCAGCKELHDEINSFYIVAEDELSSNSSIGERKKSGLLRKDQSLEVWNQPISSIIPRIHVGLPARVWYFARKRPIASSISFLAMVAIVFISFNTIKQTFADTNPSYYRFEKNNLVIYNNSGEQLWQKPIDFDTINVEEVNTLKYKTTNIEDLDGDGVNEIISILTFLNEPSPSKNVLTAYTKNGEILWRKELGSIVQYGDRKYSLDFRTDRMVFYNDGIIKRFLVLILHTHSPSAIVSIDEKGNTVGEYYNYGHFQDIALADVDGDGKNELVTTSLDDEKNQPYIAAIRVELLKEKKQSLFSKLANIEFSDALLYYTFVDYDVPFSVKRNYFNKINILNDNSINVEYGISPGWIFTFTFEKELRVGSIIATDEATGKYGFDGAIREANNLKHETKHWKKRAPLF